MGDRALATVLAFIGVPLAFLLGRAYQKAHRAYQDWQTTKAAVPVLRKAFWALVRAGIGIAMIVLIWMVGTGYFGAHGTEQPHQVGVVSPSPSPTR